MRLWTLHPKYFDSQGLVALWREALLCATQAHYPIFMSTLNDLLASLPQRGQVRWIGLRETRGAPMTVVDAAMVEIGRGLIGDHFKGTAESKRQITLIQAEHLQVVASLLGREDVDPALSRRNILVSGINLLALQHAKFAIGFMSWLPVAGRVREFSPRGIQSPGCRA